jgi:hypothetical protein
MSYRRRQTADAGLADRLSKTQRLAAVSSIRFVELSRCAAGKFGVLDQNRPVH